jgi:hypothetical protein
MSYISCKNRIENGAVPFYFIFAKKLIQTKETTPHGKDTTFRES